MRTRRLAVPQAAWMCIGCSAPFFMPMDKIFIGKVIQDELRRQGRSVVWFSQSLNCNRTNVYKIFSRTSIDTELLLKISNILNRNFFEDYSERVKRV